MMKKIIFGIGITSSLLFSESGYNLLKENILKYHQSQYSNDYGINNYKLNLPFKNGVNINLNLNQKQGELENITVEYCNKKNICKVISTKEKGYIFLNYFFEDILKKYQVRTNLKNYLEKEEK